MSIERLVHFWDLVIIKSPPEIKGLLEISGSPLEIKSFPSEISGSDVSDLAGFMSVMAFMVTA